VNYRSLATLNRQLSAWIGRLPLELDLIVGIPRSGLLAASLLSLHRNLPFSDVDGFLSGRIISTGWRYGGGGPADLLASPREILVVDDSLQTGQEMVRAKERITSARLPHRVYYAAVYVAPGEEHQVDFYCEALSNPRCFEWNILHHSFLENSCMDLDGILCRDPSEEENDDGPRYRTFLRTAEPLRIPSVPIGWVVTCRLEKYRDLTERWLARYGVKHRNLYMMDLPTREARVRSDSHASYKAEIYRRTNATLFIESAYTQAVRIAGLSRKDVLCSETWELVRPDEWRGDLRRTERAHPFLVAEFAEALWGCARRIRAALPRKSPLRK